jgi:RNA-binding protein YhbY
MKNTILILQMGKNGPSEGFIESLSKTFKNHGLIKLSVLKTCTRDREEIKQIAEQLRIGLDKRIDIENRKFITKIIGFTIIIKKIKKSSEKDKPGIKPKTKITKK